ncbi:MAG TPA: hypothetical protein VIV40_26645 [Kofleriaceae bacterium]
MSRLSLGLYVLLAACGGGGGFPDGRPADSSGPTGTFSVTWAVNDQNSQPISCDRIAAQAMTVLAHNLAFEGGSTQIFGCSTGTGMSQGMQPGTYEMSFELSGTFGSLAMGAKQSPIQIAANSNVALAPVSFQVEALGGIALKLASGMAGGNCGAKTNGGAGIDQMSITLNHNSDGTCEPVTLTISDGATQPGGSYTVSCTAPVLRGCIEADQTITATSVPSDSYTIKIRGLVTGTACWLNMDTIQIPPLNKLLLRTLNLAKQTTGC